MQSEHFINLCKEGLIDVLSKVYHEEFDPSDFHLVWFNKTLANFKCILIDLKENERMYECAYSDIDNKIYIDVYEKVVNSVHKVKGE